MKNLIIVVLICISLYGCDCNEETPRPAFMSPSQSGQVTNTDAHMPVKAEGYCGKTTMRTMSGQSMVHPTMDPNREKYMSELALELNRTLEENGAKLVRGKYHISTNGGEYVLDTFTALTVVGMTKPSQGTNSSVANFDGPHAINRR